METTDIWTYDWRLFFSFLKFFLLLGCLCNKSIERNCEDSIMDSISIMEWSLYVSAHIYSLVHLALQPQAPGPQPHPHFAPSSLASSLPRCPHPDHLQFSKHCHTFVLSPNFLVWKIFIPLLFWALTYLLQSDSEATSSSSLQASHIIFAWANLSFLLVKGLDTGLCSPLGCTLLMAGTGSYFLMSTDSADNRCHMICLLLLQLVILPVQKELIPIRREAST